MYLSDGKKETQYIVKDIGLPTGIEKRLEALGIHLPLSEESVTTCHN